MEMLCASRPTWMWKTQISVAANISASSHQGIRRPCGGSRRAELQGDPEDGADHGQHRDQREDPPGRAGRPSRRLDRRRQRPEGTRASTRFARWPSTRVPGSGLSGTGSDPGSAGGALTAVPFMSSPRSSSSGGAVVVVWWHPAPDVVGPCRSLPGRAGPGGAGPGGSGPGRSGPGRAGPGRSGPGRPAQVAPAQVAPAQVAPAQVAPAQVAPAQPVAAPRSHPRRGGPRQPPATGSGSPRMSLRSASAATPLNRILKRAAGLVQRPPPAFRGELTSRDRAA